MNGAKRVTVRRSAEEWRAIVSRYERSGQTRKQFCTSEQLAPSTFSLWRRKLRQSASGRVANGAARFVELADSAPSTPGATGSGRSAWSRGISPRWAAPPNVLGRAAVDVSFLAGLLVDKFRYHLPLYRQHRRLADSGLAVSRRSLTNWSGRAIDLLEPVVSAQAAHILSGDVVAMDETSIKAGRSGPGKMRQAYFWPVYGEEDELVFHYAPSRAHKHVEAFLGDFSGTLLSDGYGAYEAYAKRRGLAHARCWSHCRRKFVDARQSDPQGVAAALSLIGALYRHEKTIRKKKFEGPAKRAHRRRRNQVESLLTPGGRGE